MRAIPSLESEDKPFICNGEEAEPVVGDLHFLAGGHVEQGLQSKLFGVKDALPGPERAFLVGPAAVSGRAL